jgi:hypothetical protein
MNKIYYVFSLIFLYSCTKDSLNTLELSNANIIGKWQDKCEPLGTVQDLSCAYYAFSNDGTYTIENENFLLRITDGYWSITNDSTILLDPIERNALDSTYFTQVYTMTVQHLTTDTMVVNWLMFEKDSLNLGQSPTTFRRHFIRIN